MKALLYHSNSFDDITIDDLPIPSVGKDEVLVEVSFAGLNFTDNLLLKGKYQFKPDFPFSPGAEISGKVVDIGSNITGLNKGDFVTGGIGWGGMRGFVICKARHLSLITPNIEKHHIYAGSMVSYGTAYHGLFDRGKLQHGETVLILGASGSVGTGAIHLAKNFGCEVVAVCDSPVKQQSCIDHGADKVIGYEGLKKTIMNITHDNGVHVVFDLVGGSYFKEAIRCLQWRGRYLVVGFASGSIPSLPMNIALLKGIDIIGVFWSRFKEEENRAYRGNQEKLIEMIDNNQLQGMDIEIINIEQVVVGLRKIEMRKSKKKLVVELAR